MDVDAILGIRNAGSPSASGRSIWLRSVNPVVDSALLTAAKSGNRPAAVPTRFLKHGGHDWDTVFDVRGTFHLNHENIDAIEAVAGVPEPSFLLLLVLGLLAAPRFVRRGR
jgi:hypothetical protein